MAVGDFYLLTVHMKVNDSINQFGLAYEMTDGTYGTETGGKVAALFVADALPLLVLTLSEDCSVDQISFRPLGPSIELAGEANLNGADGLILGQALPANLAAIIHLPTEAPNSKHNGRIFVSGLPEAQINVGKFSAAQLTLLQTFATELLEVLKPTAPEDAEFTPVVISRFENKIKRVPPVAFNIKLPVAKDTPRQQRSRMTERLGLS